MSSIILSHKVELHTEGQWKCSQEKKRICIPDEGKEEWDGTPKSEKVLAYLSRDTVCMTHTPDQPILPHRRGSLGCQRQKASSRTGSSLRVYTEPPHSKDERLVNIHKPPRAQGSEGSRAGAILHILSPQR